MECYYHPERESTDNCAICGKSICKECGLEIAGKTYCKDCLEKIVGLGIENKTEAPQTNQIREEAPYSEPSRLERRPIAETIQQSQYDERDYVPQGNAHEIRQIQEDSPYNIRDNVNPSDIQRDNISLSRDNQAPRNEYNIAPERINDHSQDYIYPDHNLNQQANLEDKYERYLDDLYFDENELPLNEQLAKDEEQYGSLTHRPYQPRSEEAIQREKLAERPKSETPEEMEARIRAEILAESQGKGKIRDSNIHNLNYKDEKEPMNVVDIVLTIVLIIVILIVIYYIIYIMILQVAYPTFMDALLGLSNPQNVINNILSPPQ